MKKIKRILARWLLGKPKEYVYFFCLDSVSFDDDSVKKGQSREKERKDEMIRETLINNISIDLLKKKKEIRFAELLPDTKNYVTYYIFGSASPKTNLYIVPILLEIFAYKTKKSEEIFTYPIQKLIFNNNNHEITTYKFEIEC